MFSILRALCFSFVAMRKGSKAPAVTNTSNTQDNDVDDAVGSKIQGSDTRRANADAAADAYTD